MGRSEWSSSALATTLVLVSGALGYVTGRLTGSWSHPHRLALAAMTSQDDDDENELADLLGLAESADLAGAIAPLGYFDPLALSKDKDSNQLKIWRESELKHGRVAMLAAVGFLVGEQFHPLFGGAIDGPSVQAVLRPELLLFWGLLLPAFYYLEQPTVQAFKSPGVLKDTHAPGDYSFDPLGLRPSKPSEYDDLQAKELSNGRLAMLAVLGMIAQELVTGQKLF